MTPASSFQSSSGPAIIPAANLARLTKPEPNPMSAPPIFKVRKSALRGSNLGVCFALAAITEYIIRPPTIILPIALRANSPLKLLKSRTSFISP